MAPPTTKLYTLSLHDALPIFNKHDRVSALGRDIIRGMSLDPPSSRRPADRSLRSEEHTSELQSRGQLVCRLLLEKKKMRGNFYVIPIRFKQHHISNI